MRPAHAVNLGPRGRARRVGMGMLALALGVALIVILAVLGAGPGWALAAFVPFSVGMLGLIQAREAT